VVNSLKIGVTIEPYAGISADKLVTFAKAIALDHVEININSMKDVEGIIANLGKLTTTFHLPIPSVDGFEPGSTKAALRTRMTKVVDFINTYHKDLQLLFTLAHPPEGPDADFQVLIETLQQIQTPIILENIPWQDDETFTAFYFKAKDLLGKQLAGHAIDGPHRFLTDNDNWLSVPTELAKEIVYVHLQDTKKDNDTHLLLGQGEMPYWDFLRFLKRLGYKGVINQEIKPEGLDLVAIMNSCLEVAKYTNKGRFLAMKTRYAFVKPILRRKIAHTTQK